MSLNKVFFIFIAISFVFFVGCEKKSEEVISDSDKVQEAGVTPVEGENVPRDAFHGFAQGNSSPKDPDFHKGTYLNEKVGLNRQGDGTNNKQLESPDDIIKYFSEVLVRNPDDADAWLMVGSGYMLKKEPKEAIVKFQKGIAIKETPQILSNLGFALSEVGEFDEAIISHSKALKLDGEFANSYYGVAQLYEYKRDVVNAIKNWEKYIEYEKRKPVRNQKWVDTAEKRLEVLRPFAKSN